MKPNNGERFDLVKHLMKWLDSCENIEQVDAVGNFIFSNYARLRRFDSLRLSFLITALLEKGNIIFTKKALDVLKLQA